MNYSARANFVNILFIALIFVAAIGYCVCDTTIPPAIGRTVIVLSLLLGAFVIADWYHMYHSNFFGGLGTGMAAAAIVGVVGLLFMAALGESNLPAEECL